MLPLCGVDCRHLGLPCQEGWTWTTTGTQVLGNALSSLSISVYPYLKVDVGDHCSATWCIVIFQNKFNSKQDYLLTML